ncbi:hypothetical protein [Escherichia coli]|uniref:hypothetical protein n=1 Tax=Escherichia coli TaxID=562 RepID=UPI00208EA916|nr:hypothetical protein [Escherichia coli]
MTDFGGKTSIFSHPVYLFLRKFSLQDSRGGSDIRRADVALLITDIELAGAERFEHCRYVQCSIYAFLREPQRVMSAVRKVLSAPQQTHLILE